jgi:hypothetical protein
MAQIEITVEDEGAFTMPWSATVSYGTRPGGWLEKSAPKTSLGSFQRRQADVPTAKTPDFLGARRSTSLWFVRWSFGRNLPGA